MRAQNFYCKRDKLTIRGKIFGDTSEKKPVVILSHGFLANQKMCRTYAQELADIGYIAATFDFCGGGLGSKSDGSSKDMTVFTEAEDLLAVIKFFQDQSYTENISLLGCSQGGLVSAMVSKKIPNKIEKLILLYPALCIPDDARKGKMMFYRFDSKNIPETLGKFPMKLGRSYAESVIDKDAFDLIGGFSGPVLYLHGTEDKVVDISYARKAKDFYPSCEYHEIVGGGHMFKGGHDQQAIKFLRDFMVF